jgi:hypothetical protein
MKYTKKEGIYRRVRKDSTYKICNHDPLGYYFDGARLNSTYPNSLKYFLPCYGGAFTANNTGEYIRKILEYKVVLAK